MFEPRYTLDNRVRIVTTDTAFFGWTGVVVSDGERFELTKTHYFIRMDEWGNDSAALLFSESQLCLIEEGDQP